MTAQITDIVFYRGKPYSLAGISGEHELFDPASHGMKARGICTACWRGYHCAYAIADSGKLILRDLAINLDLTATIPGVSNPLPTSGPELFGVNPTEDVEKDSWFNHRYRDMAGAIVYTGGLLIAADFIRELYVHMGFHPAWKYREVHELIFEQGLLKSATDRSDQMAQLREGIDVKSLKPHRTADIGAWVEKCFSLKYS